MQKDTSGKKKRKKASVPKKRSLEANEKKIAKAMYERLRTGDKKVIDVTIRGHVGTGKTTLARVLAGSLLDAGVDFEVIETHGDPQFRRRPTAQDAKSLDIMSRHCVVRIKLEQKARGEE